MMKVKERSFFHFCQHLSIGLDQIEGQITTLKKLIQLEFKSSKNGIISIEGLDYDHSFVAEELLKEDILTNFRQEDMIFKIAWLNDFINYGKFDFNHALFSNSNITFDLTRSLPKMYDTEEFLDYISPKMAKSFNVLSGDLLKNNRFRELIILFDHLKFIQKEDYNIAFRYINIIFGEYLSVLKDLNKNNYKSNAAEINRWLLPGAIDFINCLPLRFYNFKFDFVSSFYDLINEIWLSDKKNAFKFSSLIIRVEGISVNYWNQVLSTHEMLERDLLRLEESMKEIKKSDTNLIFWLVKIIALILFLSNLFK